MSAPLATPDVRQLADDGLPRSEFPASARSDFRVYFAPAAHAAVWKHASENRTVEICGVLVGRCERDDDGPFVSVTNTIRCDEATSKFAEVTFTHESWSKINAEMDTKYADLRIVGWYHTHPDFGIFLSDRDTFIHQNFFSNPSQIAHVVDPVRRVEGVFTWQQGKPVPCTHFWVGDRMQLDGSGNRTGSDVARSSGPSGGGAPAGAAVDSRAAAGDDSLWPLVRAALPLLLMFLVGYLFSGMMTGWRGAEERNRMFRDVLAETQLYKVLKPGLTEKLGALERRLDSAGAALQHLAVEHVNLAGDKGGNAEAKRKEWTRVLNSVQDARQRAREVRTAYGLTAEEAEILDEILTRQAERAAAAAAADRKKAKSPGENASGGERSSRGKESTPRKAAVEPGSKPAGGSAEK